MPQKKRSRKVEQRAKKTSPGVRLLSLVRKALSQCRAAAARCFGALWSLWQKHLQRPVRRVGLPLLAVLALVGILAGVMLLSVSGAVRDKTEDRILSAEELASMEGEFDCILVLGCRVYADGEPSPMLYDRIQTGVQLYKAGVGKRLLMSGDNQDVTYNEVAAMQREAEELGVPAEAILCDRYGLSTYDSVVRALQEYGCKRVVIVTQSYHLYRALYVAEKLGLEAYGASADLRPYYGQAKRDLREVLARCKDVVYAHKRLPTARDLQLANAGQTAQ